MNGRWEIQKWMDMELLNIFYFNLFFLLFILNFVNCCPSQIQEFCLCVDQFDGTLKDNQVHLGLLKLLSIRGSSDNIAIIPTLEDNLFQGLYIKKLELIDCGIKILKKGAFKGLDSVLQEISIIGNKILELSFNAFHQMNSLIRLDLSNNFIEELKSEHALPRISKLSDLNLSHNRITSIHKTFFDNVKHSLQTINLGHNLLEEVPATLRGFRMLMALHLHNNNLQNLPQLSFMNLPILSLLNLASNQIRSIHRQAFLNAPQLRFLYLSANQLTEVQPFQFSSFERLEMLDLSNNKIENLQNDTFAGLPILKQLYLGENRIDHIQPEAFSSNSSIIRSIDASTFRGNPSLAMLDLSHNEIIDLAPGTFLSQLNLLLVDLSNNKILRTPYGAFGKRVATVLLKDNPLVCIEKIHMLQQGNGIFIPNSNDAFCEEHQITESSIIASTKEIEPKNTFNDEDTSIVPTLSEEEEEEDEEIENETFTSPSSFVQQIEENQQSLANNKLNNNSKQNVLNYFKNSTNSIVALNRIKPIRIIPNASIIQTNQSLNHSIKENIKPIKLNENIIGNSDFTTTTLTTTFVKQNKTENSPILTTTQSDIINPRIIYPHPVPFLKPAPKMHTATHVESDNNGNPIFVPTLPPSIVIAGNSWHFNQLPSEEEKKIKIGNYSTLENNEKVEEFPLLLSKTEENFSQNNELSEPEKRSSNNKRMLPTIIIVVCIGTVAVVIRKLRQVRSENGFSLATAGLVGIPSASHSPSSNSFINPNGAARAAQMGGFCYFSGLNQQRQYETLKRGQQPNMGGTLNRLSTTQEDIYGWLYTPCGYNAYRK
ncbi:hypothetical protein Mgra_00008217 [Meloidogyne graminicola]|uniref:LRRCT domain-containing protein n=1 Tax=Meloidogyne graminicola TaxID=189291 RepID=A0A8S9ZGE3_9BILA|nr:hypothetical protein Mgra_00008217 [Meloidogyne graminicola]